MCRIVRRCTESAAGLTALTTCWRGCLLGLCALILLCGRAQAETLPGKAAPRAMALGVQLDLFPTIASAAAGELGYAPQLWLGIDRVRIRFVAAHMQLPDRLAFAEGFVRPTTTALALVLD
jgi:hypothetical protein